MTSTLEGQSLLDALREAELADWQAMPDGIRARFATRTFSRGIALVDAVGAAAEEADHHPDVALRFAHVDVLLVSHDAGGVTSRDLRLARRVSDIAAAHGAAADPAAPAVVELALDTPDHERIAPFWSALLTGAPDGLEGDMIRGTDSGSTPLWFQPSGEHETPRQRFHLDVWVGADQAEARIAAAVAAGGRIVDDSSAPSFTVLADADGNRACVCAATAR